MRLVPRDGLTPVPWKNGGGVTRQIACFPEDSNLGSFDWRISTAEVAQDGPFSRFDGIDRRLYILEGDGLDLTFAAEGTRRLRPGEHVDFPGEAALHGHLVRGPVTDLNIMVRRERHRMSLEQVGIDGTHVLDLQGETAAVFVMSGAIVVNERLTANRFDTVICDRGEGPITVSGCADILLIGFEETGSRA